MDYVTTVTEVDSSHDLLELSPGLLLGHAPVGHEVICEVEENTGLWTQGLLLLVERAGEVGAMWAQRGSQLQQQPWRRTSRDGHTAANRPSPGLALQLVLHRGQLRDAWKIRTVLYTGAKVLK